MRYARQNRILEIIKEHEIETQDQLMTMLKDEGFKVTLTTVSRDIKDLQLVKTVSRTGKSKYVSARFDTTPISERFRKIFRDTTLSYATAQNLIVIKTLAGCGNAAAEAIDNLGMDHVVGSISGDNTLLVIVDHEDNVKEITASLDKMMSRIGSHA